MTKGESIHHQMKFEKSAHYYTLGELTSQTEYIWLVCHGYGQAAEKFIKKFDVLNPQRHYVVAPEGLSRFYWGGFSGEVVASWMTSKDRLDEIEDYVAFLHQVLQKVVPAAFKGKLVVLGFSQGVATLMRYLDRHRPMVTRIILWAGVFPPDINYTNFAQYLNSSNVHYFYGDRDQFITEERFAKETEKLKQEQIDVSIHPFSGPHRILKEVLLEFINQWHV